MRKAALLYNTLSGRRRERRLADVGIALGVLRNAGVEVSATATRSAADATEQTRQAVAEGCEASVDRSGVAGELVQVGRERRRRDGSGSFWCVGSLRADL